jgi:hypothetical protein
MTRRTKRTVDNDGRDHGCREKAVKYLSVFESNVFQQEQISAVIRDELVIFAKE